METPDSTENEYPLNAEAIAASVKNRAELIMNATDAQKLHANQSMYDTLRGQFTDQNGSTANYRLLLIVMEIRLTKSIMFQMVFKRIKLLSLFFLFCCSSQVEDVRLEVLVSDTVKVKEKVLARIYPNNTEWKILKAYFDCEDRFKPEKIDIFNEIIEGCNKELFVKDDTIYIQFTPVKLGPEKFEKIKVLLKKRTDEHKACRKEEMKSLCWR